MRKQTDRQIKSWLYTSKSSLEKNILQYIDAFKREEKPITFNKFSELVRKDFELRLNKLLSKLKHEEVNFDWLQVTEAINKIKHTSSRKKHKFFAKVISKSLDGVYKACKD